MTPHASMNFLALVSKANQNYSGWILDLHGAVMATGKDPQDVCERLARGLVSYAEDLGTLPQPSLQQAAPQDLEGLLEAKTFWIAPAEQNPISLELSRVLDQQHLTQTEVAKRMGVPRQVVGRMVDPFYWGHSVTSLRRFAEAVGAQLAFQLQF